MVAGLEYDNIMMMWVNSIQCAFLGGRSDDLRRTPGTTTYTVLDRQAAYASDSAKSRKIRTCIFARPVLTRLPCRVTQTQITEIRDCLPVLVTGAHAKLNEHDQTASLCLVYVRLRFEPIVVLTNQWDSKQRHESTVQSIMLLKL
jgi:hypothetical protein